MLPRRNPTPLRISTKTLTMEHCQAILVRKSRWSESSLLITWMTDTFGTLKTSARGALRAGSPFAGKVDLFHNAEITFTLSRSSSLHSLREISLLKPFDAPRATYQTVALASYFSELCAAVAPPMQPAHDLHSLLARALTHLASSPPTRKAFDHFEKETARLLGILDQSGKTTPPSALTQLCGKLPLSRQTALAACKQNK